MSEQTPNLEASAAAPAAPAATPPADPSIASVAENLPQRPEGLPDEYWDADKGEVKFADIVAKLTPPADVVSKVEDIDWNVDLPEGNPLGKAKVEFDSADPRVQEVGKVIAAAGFTKAQVGQILSAYAVGEAARLDGIRQHVQEQVKLLGDNAATRVKAVTNFLTENVGADKAARLVAKLVDASDYEAIETLIEKSQGPQPAPAAGTTAPATKNRADIFYGADPFKQQGA